MKHSVDAVYEDGVFKPFSGEVCQCGFCGGNEATLIKTYKSIWVSCNNCGNIVRNLREKFPLEFIPKWIWGRFTPEEIVHPRSIRALIVFALYKQEEIENNMLYDYYLDTTQKIRGGASPTSKGTKWEYESSYINKELAGWGITLEGKNVLEISGGPGFFAQELSPRCNKWVVTEYHQSSVSRMKSILGLHAIKYDFNTEDIGSLIEGTFDMVFMRHCINFCTDIRKILSSLKKKLARDAIIYVSFTQPTLASCLRWSLDQYTFQILYNPETIQKLFAEEGFVAFGKREQGTRHWIFGGYWLTEGVVWRHILASPMTLPYYVANRFKNINISAREKNLAMVFKRNPDACW